MSAAGRGGPSGSRTRPTGTAKVVAVGGGHGLAATLRALRSWAGEVTAVVSVADDGGSSGRLRQFLPVISPGDLRRCLVAMAEPGSVLASTFEYRFSDEELAGHALGNLILVGLLEATGDPVAALDEACRLLGVQGRVLPATTDPVVLKADAEGGPVAGQVAVMSTDNIRRVSLVPADPAAPPEAVAALEQADQIVIGPGSLFTSVLAAIAVPDIRAALNRSTARKVYVCNLRPQIPETEGFDLQRHVEALVEHGVTVDVALCDPSGMAVGRPPVPVVEASLGRAGGLAHDPEKLASALSDLLG